jgi:hypothetical protein
MASNMGRRLRAAIWRTEYKASILPEDEPEICPESNIMRYRYDEWNYIEVCVSERGIEIRSVGAEMLINPRGGNSIEVFLRDRK